MSDGMLPAAVKTLRFSGLRDALALKNEADKEEKRVVTTPKVMTTLYDARETDDFTYSTNKLLLRKALERLRPQSDNSAEPTGHLLTQKPGEP